MGFLFAVANHLIFWLGLVLMIEPYLEAAAPASWERLQMFFQKNPRLRRNIFRAAGALAIIIGCFQTYDEVNVRLRDAKNQGARLVLSRVEPTQADFTDSNGVKTPFHGFRVWFANSGAVPAESVVAGP